MDAVDKIEQDTATAIQDLRDRLRRDLDRLRQERTYEFMPGTNVMSGEVPVFDNYLKKV